MMATIECVCCGCLVPGHLAKETGELSEDVHREPLYACWDCYNDESD